MRSKSHLKPILAAAVCALSFAFMGVWIRMMADSFGTWQQAYLRILIAGVLAVWVFRKHLGRDFWRSLSARDWGIYGVRGIFAYTVGVGFFTIAIQHSQLAIVSFVSSLPLMGVFGWLFFREQVKVATIPFIGLSAVGLVLLTGADLRHFALTWGVVAALISLVGFDIGFLMSRLHPKAHSNFQSTTVLLLLGWFPLFLVSIFSGEPLLSAHVSLSGWVGLAMSSVFNVAVLYLINYVFSNLKAYVAGNIFLLEGVFAAILGLVFYGEIPSSAAILGGVIILVCGYLVSYFDVKRTTVIAEVQGE